MKFKLYINPKVERVRYTSLGDRVFWVVTLYTDGRRKSARMTHAELDRHLKGVPEDRIEWSDDIPGVS